MENAYDEMEDYDHFVQELDDMWGCLSRIAVVGLILLLLTFLIAKS